jgi:hypothetical protein
MRTTILSLSIIAAGCGGSDLNNGNPDMAMQVSPGDMAMQMSPGDMAGGGAACNITSQNCSNTSMPRCTIQVTGAGTMMQMSTLTCAADGTVARDAACTFDSSGLDDCLKGTICSATGSATGTVCRKVCVADSDCGTQKCARRGGGGGGGTTNNFGICVPTCTEFGSDCGAGTCAASATSITSSTGNTVRFLTCRALGTGNPGDSCSRTMPCGANMLCIGAGGGAATAQCSPLCDSATHTCPVLSGVPDGGTQWTCQPVTGISGVSACQ